MCLMGGDPHVDDVELVSLDEENHPVPDCLKTLRQFPLKMEGSFGWAINGGKRKSSSMACDLLCTYSITLIGKDPLVCGGSSHELPGFQSHATNQVSFGALLHSPCSK